MIVKIGYGAGFRGALKYCVEKEGARPLPPFAGIDETVALYAQLRARRPEIEKPVLHMSISLHPSEYLDDKDWSKVARTMLHRLGYERNLFSVVRHTDEPHSHIHIVASRIRTDNLKVVPNTREKLRAAAIAADLETEYGLMPVAFRGKQTGNSQNMAEIAMLRSKKEVSRKSIVRSMIDVALSGEADFPTFLSRCARYGVGVQANIGGDHVSGISFELGGYSFKGSKIGRGWKYISERTGFMAAEHLEILRNTPKKLDLWPDELAEPVQKEIAQRCATELLVRPGLGHLVALLQYLKVDPAQNERDELEEDERYEDLIREPPIIRRRR